MLAGARCNSEQCPQLQIWNALLTPPAFPYEGGREEEQAAASSTMPDSTLFLQFHSWARQIAQPAFPVLLHNGGSKSRWLEALRLSLPPVWAMVALLACVPPPCEGAREEQQAAASSVMLPPTLS